MKKEFLNKTGLAIQQIAGEIIIMSEGDKLPVISEFQDKYNLARGTVQNAFSYLKDNNIIQIKAQGRQGTIVQKIDYAKLQNLIIDGNLKGTMPLPYSKLFEGLATGFYEAFQQSALPFNMIYVRGAKNRITLVDEKTVHFAIVSKLAALQAIKTNSELEIVKDFGKNTYTSKHVIIFSNDNYKQIESGMKIGIDYHSYDQSILTKSIAKDKDVTFVSIQSNHILYELEKGIIDALVWNYDEIVDKKLTYLNYHTLNNVEEYELANTAVCIMHHDNSVLKKIFMRTVNNNKVLEIQNKVLTNQMIPHY